MLEMPAGICPPLVLSSQRSAYMDKCHSLEPKGVLTCWLMRSMAISFRSVKSWKAASIVETWVSVWRALTLSCKSTGTTLTSIHNQEVLLLMFVYMTNAGKQKACNRILSPTNVQCEPKFYRLMLTSSPMTARRLRSLKDVLPILCSGNPEQRNPEPEALAVPQR